MRHLLFSCLLLLPLTIIGCGGGSEDDDDLLFDAEVVDVDFDDERLRLGEGTVVRVEFRYDEFDIFDDGESVVLVVRLPEALRYREGTAEIQTAVGDDDRVGADIFDCATGEQYLGFDIDEDELINAADPRGEGDAELSFTVDSVARGSVTVQAKARTNSTFFGCGERFDADTEQLLVIE